MQFIRLFYELHFYAQQFAYCVELRDLAAQELRHDSVRPPADQMGKFLAWMGCASHGCALQLFHFEKVLEQILAIKKHPHLGVASSYCDKTAIKLVRDQFVRGFPHYEEVRHSVAHQAEFAKDFEKHAVEGMGYRATHLAPDSLSATVDGKVVRLELTAKSAATLLEIIQAARSVFDPLEVALAAVPSGQRLQRKARP